MNWNSFKQTSEFSAGAFGSVATVTMLNQFLGQRMKMDAESKAFQGSKSRLNPTR